MLTVGDVLHHGDGVIGPFFIVQYPGNGDMPPNHAPRLANETLLVIKGLEVPGLDLLVKEAGHFPVGGIGNILHRHLQQLLFGIAEKAAHTGVYHGEPTVFGQRVHGRPRRIEYQPKAFFTGQ